MINRPLVDFHCHLDLYPDFAAAVRQCEKHGVFTLAVTTTPRAWPHNEEITSCTRHVRSALGLHPQLVAKHAHEIDLFESLLPKTRYVGEVGLDAGPSFYRSLEQQKVVFERIIQCCAATRDKIISVHSVRATKSVLDIIERNMHPSQGRIVLHWFTGTSAEARRAIDLGCYFSINAKMLSDPRRMSLVKAIPIGRVLTETDGPFTQTAGRPSEPTDVQVAVELLARLHALSFEAMCTQVAENLRDLIANT